MNIERRQLLELLDRGELQRLTFTQGRLLVAISGGADSVAMLYALAEYYRQGAVTLMAVHVNHGLRDSADNDAELVREHCARCGVPLIEYRLELLAKPGGVSPEQYWRRARFERFHQAIGETGCDYVAVGHNANDLAETFLFHLARGTGVKGLSFHFRSTVENVPVVRPLWKAPRPAVEAALMANGIKWATDESNSDERFSRNLIRRRVIPALEEINPQAVRAIVELSERLMDDEAGRIAMNLAEDGRLGGGHWSKSGDATIELELREFVQTETGGVADSAKVQQAVQIIRRGGGGLVALSGGHTLVLTQDMAWIYAGQEPDARTLAAEHAARWGGMVADVGDVRWAEKGDVSVDALDGCRWTLECREGGRWGVRNRREGDRLAGRLLKKLLMECHVPWYLRDFVPVIVDGDDDVVDVVWKSARLRAWINGRRDVERKIRVSPV